MNKPFVINSPTVDYLTATSFNKELLNLAIDSIIPSMIQEYGWYETLSDAKLMQYKGVQVMDLRGNQTAFAGEGTQKQQPHFLFRTSSSGADFAYRNILTSCVEYTLSRVDVQLSCESEVANKAKLWKRFNELQFEQEQKQASRARKVVLVTDNGQGNTLYIGARQSERFIRCYQKTERSSGIKRLCSSNKVDSTRNTVTASNEVRAKVESKISGSEPDTREPVRLEIELKSRAAKAFNRQAKQFGLETALHSVLQASIEGIVQTPLLEPHREIINAFPTVELWKEPLIVPTLDKTLVWFGQCCINSAIRMLQGKQSQEEAANLVIALVQKAMHFMNKRQIQTLLKVVTEQAKIQKN